MVDDPEIARAIAVWRLTLPDGFAYALWYTPETFLPSHAAFGRLTSIAPGLAAAGPDPPRPPPRMPRLTHDETEPLQRVGTAKGPSPEAAVSLLRRARRSRYELEAADAVRFAPKPLPLPVRIEAAYLYAANRLPDLAIKMLRGTYTRLDAAVPPSPPPPEEVEAKAYPPLPSPVADAILR